ncbi:MAG: FAD-dependent monooxygenase [Candidatus Acidiferrales bacterium]
MLSRLEPLLANRQQIILAHDSRDALTRKRAIYLALELDRSWTETVGVQRLNCDATHIQSLWTGRSCLQYVDTMPPAPVLIVGAGPSGLNLALALIRRNVQCRLISEAEGPGEESRAMVVQARTLEFYGQYGFAGEVIEQGVVAETAHVREGGSSGSREVLSISFKEMGTGLSPYPFALAYPQDDHERFLIEKLKNAGCEVEWGAKLTGFSEGENGIRATIQHNIGRVEQAESEYICGCDGARSRVRETLQLGFPGGTYEQLFYVADVKIARGFSRDLYINLGKHILTLMFPVRSSGMQRLIGLVPPELSHRDKLGFEDIRAHVEPLLDIKVTDVNWFSTYRVHHRVADKFRMGRAFLVGDAGHIHSPAGGQGMNTGIGDAVNLGWKIAHVLQNRADTSLLDTYEPERIGFARSLVSTTDRAFTGLVGEGVAGEFTRRIVAPLVFGVVTRSSLGRHAIFRTISQMRVHYPDSPLSQGVAGDVHGGDRLPWTEVHGKDNFEPLRSLDWQAHVYGEVDKDLEIACGEIHLPLHAFSFGDSAKAAGFKRDALHLVRPDGYIALASFEQNASTLMTFVKQFHLRFQNSLISA